MGVRCYKISGKRKKCILQVTEKNRLKTITNHEIFMDQIHSMNDVKLESSRKICFLSNKYVF